MIPIEENHSVQPTDFKIKNNLQSHNLNNQIQQKELIDTAKGTKIIKFKQLKKFKRLQKI